MRYRLPDDYKTRKKTKIHRDETSPLNCRPHVYALSDHIASTAGLKWIIDIGCGSGERLVPLWKKNLSIIGVDNHYGIRLARETIPDAQLIVHDLQKGSPRFSKDILRNALIICSDVLEHLTNPKRLLNDLAKMSKEAPFLLISTPDRERKHDWLHNGPPLDPAHVMEWTGREFVRFMRDCGFDEIPFYGHTIDTDLHRVKSTILTVSGTHARIPKSKDLKKVAAIIHGYNEADILPEIFQHLANQGVEVHYFYDKSLSVDFGSGPLFFSRQQRPTIVRGSSQSSIRGMTTRC